MLKNKWLHYLDSILLEHDSVKMEDFGHVIDTLTQM